MTDPPNLTDAGNASSLFCALIIHRFSHSNQLFFKNNVKDDYRLACRQSVILHCDQEKLKDPLTLRFEAKII